MNGENEITPPVSGQQPEQDQAPRFLPAPPRRTPGDPFWGWHDVFLFIFLTCAAMGISMLAGMGIGHWLHVPESRMGIVFLSAQFTAYGIAFSGLRWMFWAEYDEPLALSLHWLPPPLSAWTLASLGLLQAFVIALVGVALKVPHTETPMSKLMADRPTAIVIALSAISIAPIAEEMAFRGLLQPLLIRTAGLIPGILGTACLFGAMHLAQYGSTWQSFVLISAAGAGFGMMRHWTGSTRASAIMHAGYNSALFILFFFGKGHQQ